MTQLTLADQPRLLNQLIEALGQASGAAGQIIHQHQDPRWFMVRDMLDLAKEDATTRATFAAAKISTRPS